MSTTRPGEFLDPYAGYYFALEVNSTEVAHFQECSGLKSSSDVFEIQEGGLNGRTHKRPGQSRWDNITLKYASSASTHMLEWRDRYLQDGFSERTQVSGSIALKTNDGEVVRRWHFRNAWPISWEGPSFAASSSGIAVETLVIAHDGITVS